MTASKGTRRLTVMFSFDNPAKRVGRVNPYVTELVRSVGDRADVVFFDWKTAFLGKFDVFHLQWPELLILARSRAGVVAKCLLVVALIAALKIRRTPIVLTVHNRKPHEVIDTIPSAVLHLLERSVTYRIFMNPDGSSLYENRHAVIPHGHYRTHFGLDRAPDEMLDSKHFEILLFGILRPYKNIESLIRSVVQLGDVDDLRLRIVGEARDADYFSTLKRLSDDDARISLENRFASEADLVEMIRQCNLVALPYPDLYNSGALFLALSVGRPVLIRGSAESERLKNEFGENWVLTFDGDLTKERLAAVVQAVAGGRQTGWPDMSMRDWDLIGTQHVRAYQAAIRQAHNRRK